VLIIDEDEDTRRISRAVLEHLGHRVYTATNAVEGLALATAMRPDVVVLELLLRPHTGTKLLSLLRADQRTCAIPVVAYTAAAALRDRERLLRFGFDEVALKPCEPWALAVLVEDVARRAAAAPAPAEICWDNSTCALPPFGAAAG
jgi:two-component system cell cycle response regulator DivK